MAEAADADHADPVGGLDAEVCDRAEDSDAAAEERAGGKRVESFGEGDGPTPVGANAVCEGTVAADDGRFDRAAEVVIATEAGAARHAGA